MHGRYLALGFELWCAFAPVKSAFAVVVCISFLPSNGPKESLDDPVRFSLSPPSYLRLFAPVVAVASVVVAAFCSCPLADRRSHRMAMILCLSSWCRCWPAWRGMRVTGILDGRAGNVREINEFEYAN